MRVEIALRLWSLPVTCKRLGLQLNDVARPHLRSADAGVYRYTRAVDLVVRRWPFGDTCLRRCLVTGHLIRSEHPVLRLGVRRDEGGAIVAHSWLEVGGYSLDPSSVGYEQLSIG